MERLWAPWRAEYITAKAPNGCIFCVDDDLSGDAERLILYRGKHSLVMMNRYPYTSGHLLAAPLKHTAEPDHLSPDELADLSRTVFLCRSVLREAASPEGFNIGMNLGKTAGAGVTDHLHFHIVPRWNGDTNFMSVVDDVRVIPFALADTHRQLLPLFQKIPRGGE